MTNALYQAAIQELEQILPPRVVSRTLKEGLTEQEQTPDTVEVDHFDAILKGAVYRQLQVSMPPERAKEAVSDILARLRAIAAGEPAPAEHDELPPSEESAEDLAAPAALERQEDELVGLRAALKPFNLYFEWPEVQKLRAQVQLLEAEHQAGHEATGLVEEAHRQLTAVRQKLEDHLVIQARELAELEEAFEQVQSIGGVKVRRLENVIAHVRESQDARQLAPAEVERARKLAKDLRKLVESSAFTEGDAGTPDATVPDPERLSPEVSQRLAQLDRESEARDLQLLAEEHAHLLDHLPALAERVAATRAALERGERVGDGLPELSDTLAAASERQRTALREELAQMEAQARDLPAAVDTADLLQALAVVRGVLDTTLPSLDDTQDVRRLHRLALARREELERVEAESRVQHASGLAEQNALVARTRAALDRYGPDARDATIGDRLRVAVEALAAANAEERLAPDLVQAVRAAEEQLEAAVAHHADDVRVRERAQLRALLAKVDALPSLDALAARIGGVKRELVRLIDAAEGAPAGGAGEIAASGDASSRDASPRDASSGDSVQVDAIQSLVAALRRDAIDTCRARLDQLAQHASEIDAEDLLGRIQSANNVLDQDVYPDVRLLEAELRRQRDAFREGQFAELRRLERDAAEFGDTAFNDATLEEALRLEAFLARARDELDGGGVATDLQRGWDLLASVQASVERRLADFEPRLDAALLAFQGVAMLNSEDVASARRILKHLDSQREAFPRISTGLRVQLVRALDEAEALLAKLQEEVEATRAIADRLMSGGVLDDVLGLFGTGAETTPAADGTDPDPASPSAWLTSFTDQPGVRAGAILDADGWSEGTMPLDAGAVRERLAALDRAVEGLGAGLARGAAQTATLELEGQVLVVGWLDGARHLLLLLDSPDVVSLVGHRVRTELDDLQKRLRGSANA